MRKKGRRGQIFVLCTVVLAAIVIIAYKGVSLYRQRQETMRAIAARQETTESEVRSDIIELDGRRYRRNTAVRAILCIGVDTEGEKKRYQASGQAGQADGLFLAAQDAATDRVRLLMIPRDTMTEITLFDLMGNELGKDIQHLTLAYAYGDGRESSCELVSEAVSNLLLGLRIDGYLAMNRSALPALNDEAGGVAVSIKTDELEKRDPSLKNGAEIRLTGAQAETFIRYRDISKPQSAIDRMERQKQYMKAYLETVRENAKTDDTQVTRLVNLIENKMVTDMSKDQYMDMGLAIINSGQSLTDDDFLILPGEAVETKLFDEYHPDADALKRMVVELFYKEIK